MTVEQVTALNTAGAAERALLRSLAAIGPIPAPGVAEGVDAPDLYALTRPDAFTGRYRRGAAERALSTEHHLAATASGWQLVGLEAA